MKDISETSPKPKGKRVIPPARTPEDQERRMINLAMRQAEAQLEAGTAPAQVVTHFLKLGTENAKLEREKLRAETELSRAKAEHLQSQGHYEETVQAAIEAFRSYQGVRQVHEEDYDD